MTQASAKRELRRLAIADRDAIPAEERRAISEVICRLVAESTEFGQARCVLLFASFGSEVDTTWLLRAALADGRRLVLPRVDPGTGALEIREVRSLEDDLAPGLWGIPEPVPERCPRVDLGDVDFVLVPGVAFDHARRRLGYGGGYYDRLLAELPASAAAIAICFAAQLRESVPAADHDQRVPAIITENGRIG